MMITEIRKVKVDIWISVIGQMSCYICYIYYAPYPYTPKGTGTPLPLTGMRKCRGRAKGGYWDGPKVLVKIKLLHRASQTFRELLR